MKVAAICLLACLMVTATVAFPKKQQVGTPVGTCTTVGELLIDDANCHEYYECINDSFGSLVPDPRFCDSLLCLDVDLQVCDYRACDTRGCPAPTVALKTKK